MSSENCRLARAKAKLVSWESRFKEIHGRLPTKADAVRVPEVAAKYKEYKALKVAAAESQFDESSSTLPQSSSAGRVQENTVQDGVNASRYKDADNLEAAPSTTLKSMIGIEPMRRSSEKGRSSFEVPRAFSHIQQALPLKATKDAMQSAQSDLQKLPKVSASINLESESPIDEPVIAVTRDKIDEAVIMPGSFARQSKLRERAIISKSTILNSTVMASGISSGNVVHEFMPQNYSAGDDAGEMQNVNHSDENENESEIAKRKAKKIASRTTKLSSLYNVKSTAAIKLSNKEAEYAVKLQRKSANSSSNPGCAAVRTSEKRKALKRSYKIPNTEPDISDESESSNFCQDSKNITSKRARTSLLGRDSQLGNSGNIIEPQIAPNSGPISHKVAKSKSSGKNKSGWGKTEEERIREMNGGIGSSNFKSLKLQKGSKFAGKGFRRSDRFGKYT
ncbi:hypothetical protein HDU83_003037 [Entophlyctis luteolus]|nr:hypothetical protein HDU83_003037 [Entophlyctis luteolus]